MLKWNYQMCDRNMESILSSAFVATDDCSHMRAIFIFSITNSAMANGTEHFLISFLEKL